MVHRHVFARRLLGPLLQGKDVEHLHDAVIALAILATPVEVPGDELLGDEHNAEQREAGDEQEAQSL